MRVALFWFYFPIIESTCFCPLEKVRDPSCRKYWFFYDNGDAGEKHCWQHYFLQTRPCNDYELQGECQLAREEIEDWLSGKYRKRDKILRAMIEAQEITLLSMSTTDNAVTAALENLKIQYGLNLECSEGLSTTTLNKHTHSHCHSSELLQKCIHAQQYAPVYFSKVIPELRRMSEESKEISSKFIDLFEIQFVDNTIDIHCNVSAKTELNLNEASKSSAVITTVMLFCVILNGFI